MQFQSISERRDVEDPVRPAGQVSEELQLPFDNWLIVRFDAREEEDLIGFVSVHVPDVTLTRQGRYANLCMTPYGVRASLDLNLSDGAFDASEAQSGVTHKGDAAHKAASDKRPLVVRLGDGERVRQDQIKVRFRLKVNDVHRRSCWLETNSRANAATSMNRPRLRAIPSLSRF